MICSDHPLCASCDIIVIINEDQRLMQHHVISEVLVTVRPISELKFDKAWGKAVNNNTGLMQCHDKDSCTSWRGNACVARNHTF